MKHVDEYVDEYGDNYNYEGDYYSGDYNGEDYMDPGLTPLVPEVPHLNEHEDPLIIEGEILVV